MDVRRVVAVRGSGGPGSGYVVGPRLVVTSAHCVGAVGDAVRLFRPGESPVYQSTVMWRGTARGRDDAALVTVGDPAWVPPGGRPVRWGQTVTFRPGLPCQVVGLPEAVQGGAAAEVDQVPGKLNPAGGLVGDRYVVAVDGPAPAGVTGGGSPWGGLSGAGLFCGDVLCGVVASDPAGWGHGRLHAVPAYVLHHDATFRAALAEHGGEPGLEPAEWQHLAEAPLPLAPGGLVRSPAALLTARRAVVPFRGRTGVLAELRAWAASPGFGARLVFGAGGQGKTRLARQFGAELAGSGWAALWLDHGADATAIADLKDATAPLLVVVDYAESRAGQVAALLEAASRHGGSAFKVLMLARTAGSWWDQARICSPTAEEMLDGAMATQLPALEPDADGRRAAFQDAATALAQALPQVAGLTAPDWAALVAALPVDAVRGEAFASALTLQMTALVALLDAADPAARADPAVPASQVEDRMLGHEQRYWKVTAAAAGLHPQLSMDDLADAMAAATGFGAVPVPQADRLLAALPVLSDQSVARQRGVRSWIGALYPGTDTSSAWAGLTPDQLAERFLGRYLLARPGSLDSLVASADAEQARHLLTVCARAAAHPALGSELDEVVVDLCVRHAAVLAEPAMEVAVRAERPAPLLTALQRIIDDQDVEVPTLERLSNSLPRTSEVLAPWAAALSARLVDEYRHCADETDELDILATYLHNWAMRLSALARHEEALAAIEEAVAIWLWLAEQQPDAYLPFLASSLSSLSLALGELGRREKSLAASEAAVQIHRRLADQHPDTFLPSLARSLNNSSSQLDELGFTDKSLAASIEAVTIYRRLAEQHPDTYLPDLALSLNNWSNHLRESGRRQEGLAAIEEAVWIHRQAAEQQPDMFLPDLARSLNNWSNRLRSLGRWQEGLAAIEEAVAVIRRLAERRPDAYLPNLANGLSNLSLALGELGRRQEGLAASHEAVTICRRLAEQHPDAYLPYLARSLNNWSIRLVDVGEREDGLAASREAVGIWRRLAEQHPDAFLRALATGLSNLSLALGELGRPEEGVTASREAVTVCRRLAEQNPDAHLPDLATSLNNLANRLGQLDRWEEGLPAIEEAVKIRCQLAEQYPDRFLPDLAASLNNWSMQLNAMGRREESLTASQESVRIRRQLVEQQPDAYLPNLAGSLNNLAVILNALSRRKEGLAAIEEAIFILVNLAQLHPNRFEPDLERSRHLRSLLDAD